MSIDKVDIPHAPSDDHIGNVKVLDADALALAQMGYTQDMKRNFSVLSVLGVGFSLTNSWYVIDAAYICHCWWLTFDVGSVYRPP